jgi:predicted transcriptional regulator
MDFTRMKTEDVLKKLYKLKSKGADEIPKGFKDLDQLKKEWEVHRSTAREWVLELVKAGELKQLRLRFFDGRRIQMKYFYGK